MSGSCHLDMAWECQNWCWMFVFVIFFKCVQCLRFGAHSRCYKDALTQKRSFLVICIIFRFDFHVGWKNQNLDSFRYRTLSLAVFGPNTCCNYKRNSSNITKSDFQSHILVMKSSEIFLNLFCLEKHLTMRPTLINGIFGNFSKYFIL